MAFFGPFRPTEEEKEEKEQDDASGENLPLTVSRKRHQKYEWFRETRQFISSCFGLIIHANEVRESWPFISRLMEVNYLWLSSVTSSVA